MNGEPQPAPLLSDRQRIAWLRLIRTDNVGPSTFRDLINRCGSAEAAIAMLPELAANGGATRAVRIPSAAEAEEEMERARRFRARFVAIGEADYPPMLRHMPAPPPLVAVKGEASVFALPAVSIVGARNASLAGIKMARLLAGELGREGYAVVSGLARGIDAAAHTGSLDTGTIAVMAGGLDQPYPPEHADLAGAVCARGALISEMPFGWEPRARDFPRRNRLVAGLGLGLVVVEAAVRSGSLISARLAGEMGRLVFAVPGSPLDPRSQGANRLLRDGALIVTETSDILGQLRPMAGAPRPPPPELQEPEDLAAEPPAADEERRLVREALGPTPVAIDEIVRHTGLRPAQVMLVLLEIDLAGRLDRLPGGLVAFVPD